MTTLRRLLVADYPIRLLLLVLAVWGVTADVSAQVRVGYYDMTNGNGAGIPQQVPPIVAAGFTPVLLDNVTAADLAGLHILFVENPSPNVYGQEYLASRPAITAAVNAGMVLVIHDRTVNNPAMMARVGDILPGVTAPASIIASKGNAGTNNAIEVSVATGLVVNGPFGQITSTNLDGGMQSNHGHVNILNPFFTTRGISGLLHTGSSSTIQSQSVTFSYAFGLGYVIYSTIPLDKFLKSTENVAPVPAFRDVYAPNLLTYAACGLRAFPATVTAASATGHYGGTTTLTATVKCGVLPASGMTVTFSLNGVVVGSAQTDASGTAALMNASLGSSPASAIAVGTYASGVLADFGGAPLFGASSATASLTVEKAPASIAVEGGTFVYDGTPHAAAGTASGVFAEPLGLPSFTYTDKDGVTTDVAPVNVGKYDVTASVAESENYLGTTDGSSAKIMITPASLVVTAHDASKIYGAALPDLTATIQGFVGDEDTSVLAGTLQLTTEATAASPVHEYKIEPSGVNSDNYDIKFVAGTLAVTPAALTVRAEDASKIYGAALPEFTAAYSGFVLGETADVLTGTIHFTTDATAASAVGHYPITPAGLNSHNYAIGFVDGALTVTPAALTVRADNKSKVYGAALPALTASYEGFVLHDGPGMLAGTLNLSTNATAASDVAEYAITPSGLTSANYAIVFINGILKVTPAALTIRANDQERLIGLPNPTLIVTYEGFVAGDTAGGLDVPPSVTTTAVLLSPAGTYPIVVRAATDANYSIQHVNGVLTVSPEGRMHGDGFIGDESQTFSFRFDVRDRLLKGERGSIELTVDRKDSAKDEKKDKGKKDEDGRRDTKKPSSDRFASKTLTSVVFSDDPDFIPGKRKRNPEVDSVAFAGIGTWNGVAATFDATASDRGEPGRGHDHVRIIVRVAGAIVAQVEGPLDAGNVQSNRLPGGIR